MALGASGWWWWVACALAVSACDCMPPPMHPPDDCSNCLGCCNGALCESGLASTACGAKGAACVACPNGAPCIHGICEGQPLDGGELPCGLSTCPPAASDICIDGRCQCGTTPICGTGTRCVHGACECTAATCTNGCCSGNVCLTDLGQSTTACGQSGNACVNCAVDGGSSDHCFAGQCVCGSSGACLPDALCRDGACVCMPALCDGCCSEAGCLPLASQTAQLCGNHDACRACGNAGDVCRGGACFCGDGGACPDGTSCNQGRCICDSLSCADGCCQKDICVRADQQDLTACGTLSGFCISCPSDALCKAGGCTCQGRLECGALGAAAGANHTCAITASHQVRCWGDDASGQVGIAVPDAGTDQLGPATLPLFGTVSALAAGDAFTCAIAGGIVYCWGDTPLGSYGAPQVVNGLSDIDRISAGAHHACAQAVFGSWCWGDNSFEQVAPADAGAMVGAPYRLPGMNETSPISAGARHTCARFGENVGCWGHFLAAGTTAFDSDVPKGIAGLSGVRLVASGDGQSCAATVDGGVTCFGRMPLTTLSVDAVDLCVGGDFACAVTPAGTVVCWGDNAFGQLGHADGGTLSAVVGVSGATSVACGRAHACAIVDNHQIACWGDGAHYKLGNASAAPQASAVLVSD